MLSLLGANLLTLLGPNLLVTQHPLHLLCVLALFFIAPATGGRASDSAPFPVATVEGGQAMLPCNISSGPASDSVYLVLWYRKDSGTPIYSYDSRTGDPGNPGLWSEPKAFGERAFFRVGESPAVLAISNLTKEDGGIYTCRVDYTESPTMYHNVKLDVIVPPSQPRILGDRARQLDSSKPVGPFKEGDPLTIMCVATGGEPPPSVLWYKENQIIDRTYIANEKGAVQNTLTIQRLSREDMGPRYRCVASNNNITKPMEAWVSLDIMFPPLGAKIITEDQPLVAGREYSMGCVSWGSLPPAEITWYRRMDNSQSGFTPMVNANEEERSRSKDNNVTESWIRFTPTPANHMQVITCRAVNYKLHGVNNIKEDHRVLDVFFPPQLELRLGPAVNPRDLEEGDDVYFECHIRAHPPAYKVTWRHNGLAIYPRPGDGKIISNQSLVLQKVTKEDAGNYTCQAFNVEGQMSSLPQTLDILYRPICLTDQKMIYGVSEQETAHISCTVDSNPKADSFFWTLNNTAGHAEIPGAMSTDMAGASLLSYRPMSQLEYGTIFCYGSNMVGRQESPCVFHIIPAIVPETPIHCHIANQTLVGLRVLCDAGFDGGLQQTFHMEVLGLHDDRVHANLSRDVPSFWATGLPPGEKLYIRVFASNSKGRCAPIILKADTSMAAGVGYPIKHEREVAEENFSVLLVLLLGTVLTFILLGVVVGLFMRCSDPIAHNHRQHQMSRSSDNGFDNFQQQQQQQQGMKGGSGLAPGSLQFQTSVFQSSRVSPDLIPEQQTFLGGHHGYRGQPQERGGFHCKSEGGAGARSDSSASSGFSSKAESSEASCSQLYRSMTAADASPSPGSPSNLNSGIGPMSRSTLDPMTGAVGSNLDPMGPLGLGGVGTMGRVGRSSEQRRPGSGEVFPSDLQIGPNSACSYSTMPRWPLRDGATFAPPTATTVPFANNAAACSASARRKLFSTSSLQLNLNCVKQDQGILGMEGGLEGGGGYLHLVSAKTPLIEVDSDRESCV